MTVFLNKRKMPEALRRPLHIKRKLIRAPRMFQISQMGLQENFHKSTHTQSKAQNVETLAC